MPCGHERGEQMDDKRKEWWKWIFGASPQALLRREDFVQGKGWAFRPGDSNLPLLLAHVDTVRRGSPPDPLFRDSIITARDGGILGADNRAGVSLLFHVHANCLTRFPMLLTDGEESGGWGMDSFLKSPHAKDNRWSFLWSFDFRGSLSFTSYTEQDKDFLRWFAEKTGAAETSGTWSDVKLLAEKTGLAHVNFSCGYSGAHFPGESLSIPAWESSLRTVVKNDWNTEKRWFAPKIKERPLFRGRTESTTDWYKGWNRVDTGYCVLCGRRTSADELCSDCARQINGLEDNAYVS